MKKQVLIFPIACAAGLLGLTAGSLAGKFDNLVDVFKYADDAAAALKQGDNAAIDGANAGRKLDDGPGSPGSLAAPPKQAQPYPQGPSRAADDPLKYDIPLMRQPYPQPSSRALNDPLKYDIPSIPPQIVRQADEAPPVNADGYASATTNKGFNAPPSAYSAAKSYIGKTDPGKPSFISRNADIDANDLPSPPSDFDLPSLPAGLGLPDVPLNLRNRLPDSPNPAGKLDDAPYAQLELSPRNMRPSYPARYHEALAKASVPASKASSGTGPKKVIIAGTVTGLLVAGGVTTYVLYETYQPVTDLFDGTADSDETAEGTLD